MEKQYSAVIGAIALLVVLMPFKPARSDELRLMPTDPGSAAGEIRASGDSAPNDIGNYFSEKFHLTLNNIYWESSTHTQSIHLMAPSAALYPPTRLINTPGTLLNSILLR